MKETSTEQRIREAAGAIFQRKGLAGARMQEIADAVGINKAMLHYYFKSKEQLFQAVFDEVLGQLFAVLAQALGGELPLLEKIPKVVADYTAFLQRNPQVPVFVLNELATNPERVLVRAAPPWLERFAAQVAAEVRAGTIRPIDPRELLINILALCVFPFAAQPMLMGAMKLSKRDFAALIERRKREVPAFILQAIRV